MGYQRQTERMQKGCNGDRAGVMVVMVKRIHLGVQGVQTGIQRGNILCNQWPKICTAGPLSCLVMVKNNLFQIIKNQTPMVKPIIPLIVQTVKYLIHMSVKLHTHI